RSWPCLKKAILASQRKHSRQPSPCSRPTSRNSRLPTHVQTSFSWSENTVRDCVKRKVCPTTSSAFFLALCGASIFTSALHERRFKMRQDPALLFSERKTPPRTN